MKSFVKLSLFVLMAVGVGRCAGPLPIEEYTLSRAAMDAAKASGAPAYAKGKWHKAQRLYRKGESLFKANDNDHAKEYFLKAMRLAERAENQARLKKFQSGETFP